MKIFTFIIVFLIVLSGNCFAQYWDESPYSSGYSGGYTYNLDGLNEIAPISPIEPVGMDSSIRGRYIRGVIDGRRDREKRDRENSYSYDSWDEYEY